MIDEGWKIIKSTNNDIRKNRKIKLKIFKLTIANNIKITVVTWFSTTACVTNGTLSVAIKFL